MKIRTPIIESDVMSSMVQMIADEKLYETGWIYNFFCRLVLDKRNQEFSFRDYGPFWEYGIFLKRYYEYPWKDFTRVESVYKFIVQNLKNNYYLMEYVNEFELEKVNYKSCVLVYDCCDNDVMFCCWQQNNKLQKIQMNFEEFYHKILLPSAQKEHKFVFDMQRVVSREKYQLNIEQIRQNFQKAQLNTIIGDIRIMKMNCVQREYSAQVFQEWLNLYRERYEYMKESGFLLKDSSWITEKTKKMQRELIEKSDVKTLKKALRLYNELCHKMLKII